MSGMMRMGVSGNVNAGANTVAIDRDVLPKGMYVVKVKVNGALVVSRVVKISK
jgi:rhamnogalacturonan endolyase